MSTEKPQIVRPVGNLERFSTARHNLGYYRCVCHTAKYSIDSRLDNLSSILENALAKVVLRYPALCCGIINEEKNDPAFVRLETVDISKCIEYQLVDVVSEDDYDEQLMKIIETQHRQLWLDLDHRPGWKVIVVQKKPNEDVCSFDAIYAFHHAFGDGLSGLAFHRALLKALNNPSDEVNLENHILQVPESLTLPLAVEKAVDFRISWFFLFKTLWNEFGPSWPFPQPTLPWAGNIPDPAVIEKYESRMEFITISEDMVSNLLKICREQKATLTGLLHGLIIVSLTHNVPTATSFTSATPFSLRKLTGLSPTEGMGAQVSSLSSTFSSETIAAVRAASDPDQLSKQIWKIARDFRSEMVTELAGLPNDNILGMLPYVSSIHEMFTSKLGKPRAVTYELSNIGKLDVKDTPGRWRIRRVVFSQSGMVTGPAMSFNVASVGGGPLSISSTWLEGEVDGEIVSEVFRSAVYALRCIGEGKEVSFDS